MLAEKEISKQKFREQLELSTGTMTKLNKGEEVSMNTLLRICEYFDCNFGDICDAVKIEETEKIQETHQLVPGTIVTIYEESCPLCGEKGKYIATDIRPVFPEEKILLAILLEKDDPLCFEELSVWNNTNFYFIDGEKIQVSIKDFNGKTLD